MRLFELSEYDPVGLGSPNAFYHDAEQAKLAVEVAEYIKQNCKPWLEQTGLTAYRGFMRGSKQMLAFTKAVRHNRSARDTDKISHEEFNDYIRRCGKIANRTNSVFLTSNRYHAANFGTVYVVFPVGNFHYTWLPNVSDWTEDITQIDRVFACGDLKGDDWTLSDALKRGAEVMVSCDKIVAVDPYFYTTQVSGLI